METLETRAPVATRLISVRQAATIAAVSKTHVWRLIQRGEVEAVRVGKGGPLRIDAERFLTWLYDRGDDAA
jgi:excisionase family DNA binding protein